MKKRSLTEQLFIICIIVIFILIISLGIILPNMLVPVYETNVYNYLKQPLSFVQSENDINETDINTEIAYIYISSTDNIKISENLKDVINIENFNTLFSKLNLKKENGKFKYKRHNYYYVTEVFNNTIRIAITNDSYIEKMKKSILIIIIKVVGMSLIMISAFIITWSNNLVNRIKKIKNKVDNITNDNYSHKTDTKYQDELYTLDRAVYDMHNYLKEQDEYKNQMYQNISHDFKTPITVMKSYIEAEEDGIEKPETVKEVLKEQLNKLEIKVHSLLYLNKLNYLSEKKDILNGTYDVSIAITSAAKKFKAS